MKNYRFTTEEINRMKDFILTSINNETEKRTAWRARLVYEMEAQCSRTKKSRTRGERMLALYEQLTTNDLPNWNPIIPTEGGKYRLIIFNGKPHELGYCVKLDFDMGFVYIDFDTMEDAQKANEIITPDHEINFNLSYPDGVICDRNRPLREVTIKETCIEELLFQMEQMFYEEGSSLEEVEFYIDGKGYEYNGSIMHGYWNGRVDLKYALKEMRLHKAA